MAPLALELLRNRVWDFVFTKRQLFLRLLRLAPVGVDVGLVILVARHVRPTVVHPGLQNVDFIIALRAVFGCVKGTVWAKRERLRVTVAVGVDVATHAVKFRIILWNAPV